MNKFSYEYSLPDVRKRAASLLALAGFADTLPAEDRELIEDMANENGNTEFSDARINGLRWIETKAEMFARHPERYTPPDDADHPALKRGRD